MSNFVIGIEATSKVCVSLALPTVEAMNGNIELFHARQVGMFRQLPFVTSSSNGGWQMFPQLALGR